jgi:hypothetical protein
VDRWPSSSTSDPPPEGAHAPLPFRIRVKKSAGFFENR